MGQLQNACLVGWKPPKYFIEKILGNINQRSQTSGCQSVSPRQKQYDLAKKNNNNNSITL